MIFTKVFEPISTVIAYSPKYASCNDHHRKLAIESPASCCGLGQGRKRAACLSPLSIVSNLRIRAILLNCGLPGILSKSSEEYILPKSARLLIESILHYPPDTTSSEQV